MPSIVRKDFAPMVSTTVSEKVVDAGSPIFDDVTSGVADSSSHWVPDLALQAEGYYFIICRTVSRGNTV